jgi:hypothetical protein
MSDQKDLNIRFSNSISPIPVFKTHDIVEDRIKCSTEVVEEARDMEKIFIDKPEEFSFFKVDECEALGMEGSPADEEGNYNGG